MRSILVQRRWTGFECTSSGGLAQSVSAWPEVLLLPLFIVQGAIGFHDSSFPNVMMRGVCTSKVLYANAAFPGGARFLWRVG